MMHGFGFGFGGFFGMIIIWGLLIVGSVLLVRALFSGDVDKISRKTDRDEDPLIILKKRYARGELKREEFELMKNDLINEK
jgi:putative membrane protein